MNLRDTIQNVIIVYEPRAVIDTLDVVPDEYSQTYYIDIVFSLRNTNQKGTVQFFIDRIR
jgi:hypothetical protein